MSVRFCLLIFGLLAACVMSAPADDEEDAKLVTLTAEDTPAAEVAATMEEQTEVQVVVTERTVAKVTGELEEMELEDAVVDLARAVRGTYLRAYLIEREPPEEPYSAEALIQALQTTRQWWLESMSEEERQELFTRWREQWQQRREQQQAGDEGEEQEEEPEQHLHNAEPEPAAQEGEQQPGEGRRRMEDPLRGLGLGERHETISLDLEIAGPSEAVAAFISASGYLLLVDPELEGAITFSVQEAPLSDVLDGIAEGLGGEWRPFYIISQPYELTEEEREQRAEQRFNQRWAEYWGQDPATRAQELQERIGRLERMVERMNNPEGQGRRGARMARRLPRMVTRTTQYALTLTAEQRLELKPYLQALARAANSIQAQ